MLACFILLIILVIIIIAVASDGDELDKLENDILKPDAYVMLVAILQNGNQRLLGKINLREDDGATQIYGKVMGLEEGKHGFHIHANPITNNDCKSGGGHYNPEGKNHGGPTDTDRHVGDLGNIVANKDGVAEV